MFDQLLSTARRRKTKLYVSLLVAAVVLLPLSGVVLPAAAQDKSFVLAANGDPYEAMWRRSLIPAFEKMTGMNVVWSAGLSAQNLAKIIQQKASPQIDVAFIDEI